MTKPRTDDLVWTTCPSCGWIAEKPISALIYCPRCHIKNVPHRLMTVPEALRFARLAFGTGQERAATLAEGAAVNLIRYATIVECMRVAGDAYSEASYAGVDAHGSYDSAMDAVQELLKGMQDDASA